MFRIFAVVFATSIFSPADDSARRTDPPLNQHGLPVRDADGKPIFYGRELDARSESASAEDDAAVDLAPPGVTARWGYAGFGSGIGLSDIVLSDGEIIVGGSILTFGANDYFYVLRRSGSGYEQVFVSRSFPGLVGLAAADVVGDARKEIVVARSNGSIVLFDQGTRDEFAAFGVAATDVAGMTVRDLDGNGKAEILLTTSSSNTLHVLSGAGAILWQRAGAGGTDVTVGNMDADASLEIATTSGAVADWATQTIQWTRAQGFGIDVEVGDIDGDGKDELIAAQAWDFIWAFDVDTQLPKWSLPMFNTGAIWVGNVDADAELELLVGEAQWGDVKAFNTITLVEEWAIPNPEHGVTDVVIGDPNEDGVRDVLWGAGATSTGADRLYVANLATHAIDWENIQLEGQFLAPQWGDIDGDGIAEIVTASRESDSGYDSGRIVVLDGVTLQVRAISPPVVANNSLEGIHDLKLRNVDGDAALEIVIGADRLYDGVIEIYNFAAPGTFTVAWTNATRPSGSPFFAVEVADVDADGVLEVVGSVGKAHTGSPGTFLYVYSLATAAEEWHSPALTTGWLPADGLAVLTAGGGVADIAVMVGGEKVTIFDGTGQWVDVKQGAFRYVTPVADASRTFLTGGDGGTLQMYVDGGASYPLTWSRTLGGAAVDGVTFLPDGAMMTTSAGRLSLYPNLSGAVRWTSEDYGVRGAVTLGTGANRRPFVGGRYAVVSLAPWRPILDVAPPQGPTGTLITATGSGFGFDSAAEMYVGGKAVSSVQVSDNLHITGKSPPLPLCSLNDVIVVNPDMSYLVKEDAFTARRFGGVLTPPCRDR